MVKWYGNHGQYQEIITGSIKVNGQKIVYAIKQELEENDGKLSQTFCEEILDHYENKVTHTQVTPNTRVCVITLFTGHDLIGVAQVLDAKNDVKEIGQSVALEDAREKIWQLLGTIAKVV